MAIPFIIIAKRVENDCSIVMRGEFQIRASDRLKFAPNYDNFDIGFRCASPLP